MEENFKSGVFKVSVGDEIVYFYAQSSLVSYNGNLYYPEKFDDVDSVAFMQRMILASYRENKKHNLIFMRYCGHERCKNARIIVIRNVDADGIGFYNQNHLIDRRTVNASIVNDRVFYSDDYQIGQHPRVISRHLWSRFILNQDRITTRIVRIQHFVKSLVLLKKHERLHLLAGFAIANTTLNSDVISVIAKML